MTLLTSPDMYDNEELLIKALAHELFDGKLAIILGSGISVPFGLPCWDLMIDQCCQAKNITIPTSGRDNLKLAEYIRINCASKEEYHELIERYLYDGVNTDIEALRKNRMFYAITNLTTPSRRGCVKTIVTYNFDDLLEHFFRDQGKIVESIIKVPCSKPQADIIIYHPHGFLPSFTSIADSEKWIILDRLSYAERVTERQDWMRVLQTIFRENTCIFVGLSLNDFDLDADIVMAKDGHPTLKAGNTYWGIRFAKRTNIEIDENEKKCMHNRSLYLKLVNEHIEIANLLISISQKAAEIAQN